MVIPFRVVDRLHFRFHGAFSLRPHSGYEAPLPLGIHPALCYVSPRNTAPCVSPWLTVQHEFCTGLLPLSSVPSITTVRRVVQLLSYSSTIDATYFIRVLGLGMVVTKCQVLGSTNRRLLPASYWVATLAGILNATTHSARCEEIHVSLRPWDQRTHHTVSLYCSTRMSHR